MPVRELESSIRELALVRGIKDTFANWTEISRIFPASLSLGSNSRIGQNYHKLSPLVCKLEGSLIGRNIYTWNCICIVTTKHSHWLTHGISSQKHSSLVD